MQNANYRGRIILTFCFYPPPSITGGFAYFQSRFSISVVTCFRPLNLPLSVSIRQFIRFPERVRLSKFSSSILRTAICIIKKLRNLVLLTIRDGKAGGSNSDEMGRLFIESLPGPKIFKCKFCKVDSAAPEDIVSKDFHGRFGKAYLFRKVVNICLGPNEERELLSGLHIVNDIYCSSCQQILGWKYEKAYEESERYKEGLYILERERIFKHG